MTAPWNGQLGAPASGPPAPQPQGRGRELAIIIAVFCIVLAVALTVLFFTGVIRFGSPRVSGIKTAARVDRLFRPVDPTTEFSGKERRVYCCARVRAFEDTVLEVRWFLGSAQVGGYAGTYGAIADSSTGKTFPSSGNVAFFLDRPSDGWLGGSYRVAVFVNGRRGGEARFSMGQLESGSGLAKYEDPGGAFSVGVPSSWAPADETTMDEALAGFTADGEGYPPRFVVVATGYESVDPAYLNEQLALEGQAPSAQFGAYSLGETPGARRDFEWDYRDGDQTVKLHTIQVVVLGVDGTVYGLNCHSLSSDYESNLPTFNAIINSFTL